MKTLKDFKNKAYRDEFVSAGIDNGIAFQIFAMREQRHWSQQKLATAARKRGHQPIVSRWEKPGHRFNLATLKEIASAFDVALIVRFVPYSELLKWSSEVRPGSFEVPSFQEEMQTGVFNSIQPEQINAQVKVKFMSSVQWARGVVLENSLIDHYMRETQTPFKGKSEFVSLPQPERVAQPVRVPVSA